MWLDRITAQTNQQPSSTALSCSSYNNGIQSARASNSLGPYVISQRSSSAQGRVSPGPGLINDPSISLLVSARNQSNRSQSPTPYSPDALVERLLEVSKDKTEPIIAPAHSLTDDDLDLEYDFSGMSLSEFVKSQPQKPASRERPLSIDPDKEKEKFDQLHKSIIDCDTVLDSVEANLESFRSDLEFVSADIETLQARSTALNIRVENRKAVERALGPLVEDLSVSPAVVTKISEGSIDETWIRALHEVDRRAVTYKKETNRTGKSWTELGPLLEKLVAKALERIRDHIVAQIRSLRSPGINAQIIQQQSFLKFKDGFAFLYKHNSALGNDICQAYMNTIRWYYLYHFTRYQKALEKIKVHVMDKNDAIGYDDSKKGSMLSVPSIRQQVPPHDTFNLGHRIDLLKTNNQTALPSYLAEETTLYHYLEVPFRNFNLALVDNATAEYTFLVSFFSPSISLSTIQKHFNYIFEPTFTLGQTLTQILIASTYDALGLLLCIRLTQHFAFELQRRRVPTLEAYINTTNMALWPRLQKVMDFHSDSVHSLTTSLPSKPSSSNMSFAPHMLTQRWGQILQAILALSSEAADDEPVITSLGRLRMEVETFLSKYAQVQSGGDQRKRARFLYNNFSLISTIISDTIGKLAQEHQGHYDNHKKQFQEES